MTGITSTGRRSLRILTAYTALALAAALWRIAGGTGSWFVVSGYVLVIAVALVAPRRPGPIAQIVTDWMPLLALPVLYASIPATIVNGGHTFDPVIQGWERALFGTEPARTLAGAIPFAPLSELLHAAYLSYYLIIYGPPLALYLKGQRIGFAQVVTAFTITMALCFLVFCLFPVAGPRFEWGAPAGVPGGFFRSMAVMVLAVGSARGTAFPSSHLAIALAMGLSSMRWAPKLGAGVLVLAALLAVGAVYGGFHYGVDMGAGAVVGVVGWGFGRRLERGKDALG